MKKNTQPDTPMSRGALIAGCSMWKPILAPVCHGEGEARLGGESVGEHGECPEAGIEDEARDPSPAVDASV